MQGTILQHAGQGDAHIGSVFDTRSLDRRLALIDAQKARKAAAEVKAREDRDKKIDDLMKWNPDGAWYPHTEQLNQKVKNVFDYGTQLKMSGARPTPEQERQFQDMKWDAEVTAKKSKDLQSLYPQLRGQIGQTDKYTDKALLNTKLNDEMFGIDGKKDVNQVNFDRLNNLTQDPDAFKVTEYSRDFAKSLPEMIDTQIQTLQLNGGPVIQDKEIKSKFLDLDANGNVKYDKNNNPIIKLTPDTVDLFMQEPRVKAYVEAAKANPENKYTTDAEIVKGLLSPYASRAEKISITKGKSEGGDKKDSPILSVTKDVYRNRNAQMPSGKYSTTKGWIPLEADLNQEKFKLLLNPRNRVNVEDNTDHPETAGAANYTLTKILYLPVDSKTGQRLHGDKNVILKKPGVVFKPFVEGVRHEEIDGEKTNKTELFPYEQAKSYLDAAGVDLNELGFNNPLGINNTSKSDPLGILK